MRHPKDIELTPMMAVTVVLWFLFGLACLLLISAIAFHFAPDDIRDGTTQGAIISSLAAAITGPAAAFLQRRQRQDWKSGTRKVEASAGTTSVASAAVLVVGLILTGVSYASAAPGGRYLAYPGMIVVGAVGCMFCLLRRGR